MKTVYSFIGIIFLVTVSCATAKRQVSSAPKDGVHGTSTEVIAVYASNSGQKCLIDGFRGKFPQVAKVKTDARRAYHQAQARATGAIGPENLVSCASDELAEAKKLSAGVNPKLAVAPLAVGAYVLMCGLNYGAQQGINEKWEREARDGNYATPSPGTMTGAFASSMVKWTVCIPVSSSIEGAIYIYEKATE